MMIAQRLFSFFIIPFLLSGCLSTESLKKSVTEAATLQQVCVGMAATPEQQRDADYRSIRELIASYLQLQLRPQTGTWREALLDVRTDIQNAYRNGNVPVRVALRSITQGIDRIETRFRAIRATIDSVNAEGRSIFRQAAAVSDTDHVVVRQQISTSGTTAFKFLPVQQAGTFVSPGGPIERLFLLVFQSVEAVEPEVRNLGLDLLNLHDDIEALRHSLPSEVATALVPKLAKLKTSADTLFIFWEKLTAAASGSGTFEMPNQVGNAVEAFVNRTIEREAGRLAIELFHRAARSIEGRLDNLSTDQWIAMAIATYLVSEAVSAAIRKTVETAFKAENGKWENFSDWALVGLTQGACARMMAANDASASDAFRADELLRPVYQGVVHAYACSLKPGGAYTPVFAPEGFCGVKAQTVELKDLTGAVAAIGPVRGGRLRLEADRPPEIRFSGAEIVQPPLMELIRGRQTQ
jgi:hypothetical protein